MVYKGVGMEKILIFKTSTDVTIQKLFHEFAGEENKDIDCLIQHSHVKRYQEEYPYINFIDIQGERFENLSLEIMEKILENLYDIVYVTLTGANAYGFWNVISIVSKVRFKKGFFYNCNGEKMEIPRKNKVKDTICRLYIKWVGLFY